MPSAGKPANRKPRTKDGRDGLESKAPRNHPFTLQTKASTTVLTASTWPRAPGLRGSWSLSWRSKVRFWSDRSASLLVSRRPPDSVARRSDCSDATSRGRATREASVYRLLKADDLIASPSYIVIEAPRNSRTRPRCPNSSGGQTSPTSRLQLLLSLHRSGRLFAPHCRLDALRDDESAGRHGDAQ
jgi:hypothetical protein